MPIFSLFSTSGGHHYHRHRIFPFLHLTISSISSLKVPWRKDRILDATIDRDNKRYRLASRVIREVLLSPGHRLPVRYLEKRRQRLRLRHHIPTFLRRHPNLLSLYPDRITPGTPLVPFLKPSSHLLSFLAFQSHVHQLHANFLVSKLAKLLMISTDRVIPVTKIVAAKRDFGFPDDFLVSLVPKHPEIVRLVGDPGKDGNGNAFLELVSWNAELAKSAVEVAADEEAALTGIRPRPNFSVRLPKGFYLKKDMREWVRDWLELPYVSPYNDAVGLQPASPEAEKRAVGVLHEVLSLAVDKRMAVPIIGKFSKEFRLSNAFANVFTRHPGIFYVSLKGGIKTAVLREAYDERGELVDRDPMVQVKERFMAMIDEGHREYLEGLRRKQEELQRDMELMARKHDAAEIEADEEDVGETEEEEESEAL